MTLAKYLEENEIDQIEDDQEFIEAEYEAIREYCKDCNCSISDEDLDIIKSRGLEESFLYWTENLMKV